MAGSVAFTLDPPDGTTLPPPPVGILAPGANPVPGGTQVLVGQMMPVVALPPRLPCASDPGSYTELWMRQTSSTSGQEMHEQVGAWLDQYNTPPVDYNVIVEGIIAAADWVGFLTVFKGNAVSLVHSLGQFRTGLGPTSPGNGRTFGLVGERVGTGTPPIIMVPSTAGLTTWMKPVALHEPSDAEIAVLKGVTQSTIPKPTVLGDETKDEDPDHPMVEVTTLCFIPKAWGVYFLDQCTPYEAYERYQALIATIPVALRDEFRYMESWLKAACVRSVPADESMLTAKWQAPVIDRKVNTWMERHTQYVNAVPFGMLGTPPQQPGTSGALDPQMCF